MKRAMLCACALWGCSGQVSDLGLDAQLSVRGGTFVRSELPSADAGPGVEAAFLGQTAFAMGQQGKSFSGALSETATAVAISLAGDLGYWSVPAGPPSVETPTLPSFDAPLSFSKVAAAGPHSLWLSAVDSHGHFGPKKPVAFTLTARPVITGTLTFSLYWDRQSDLDLHVVLPDGTEVYKDERNSWEPTPGVVEAPNAFETGGRLDLDSNAQCRIDGRNNENVIWTVEPPHGSYTVRVDTFSLCSESAARWSVEARLHGERVALSEGESVGTDTRGSHGAGAGVTAFELRVE